jgi:hypothetical protein
VGVVAMVLAVADVAAAEPPRAVEATPAATPPDRVSVAADAAALYSMENPDTGMGFGLDARLAFVPGGWVVIAPEAVIGYVRFPGIEAIGRAGGGARLVIGDATQAALFGHLGGWWHPEGSGPGADLGMSVDFALADDMKAGMQGGLNFATNTEFDGVLQYASLGVHLGWAPRWSASAAPRARPAGSSARR